MDAEGRALRIPLSKTCLGVFKRTKEPLRYRSPRQEALLGALTVHRGVNTLYKLEYYTCKCKLI